MSHDTPTDRRDANAVAQPSGHDHYWIHDDVEPGHPPVSVSRCSCGATRRAWQGDDGVDHEEIEFLS